ncbi:tRNA (mnm(5)s(2)U34)-methyltransferase [Clostridium thermarum]|uniref:tRNA (mnm(5)s(2)U34)-methyltransferase n=1 Tax=Clostridium thermarum TaxID=1716543 RepID=UPI0013D59CD6|nr:class I SAM-dependent methyltransferase [Clostridium thermarum]
MFRYVNDVSNIAQNIIQNYCRNYDIAIDATLGNGHDTDFLSSLFKRVYSFDIQKQCILKYKAYNRKNVVLINDSHEKIHQYVREEIDCAMYNLGFLPGGDKNITTNYKSTLLSIEDSLTLLKPNGLITIAIYTGHDTGKLEKNHLLHFVKNLPKNTYGVLHHTFLNRHNNPPELLVIEKK